MISDFFAVVSSGQSADRYIAYHEKVGKKTFSASLAVIVLWIGVLLVMMVPISIKIPTVV